MGLKLYNTLPTFLKTEPHSFVSFRSSLKKKFIGVFNLFHRWVLQYLQTRETQTTRLGVLANPYTTIYLFIAAECH